MNRFIKRNILLVTFFVVALIGMLVMMGLTIWQYVDMRTATVKAEELGKTIDSLSAQTPAPSKENIRLIKEDLDRFQMRLDDVRVVFGQPMAPAVKVAYRELGLYKQAQGFFIRDLLTALADERDMVFEDDNAKVDQADRAALDAMALEIDPADQEIEAEKLLVSQRLQDALAEMSILMEEPVEAATVKEAVTIAFEKTYFPEETMDAAQRKLLKNIVGKAVKNCGTVFADDSSIADAVAAAMDLQLEADIAAGTIDEFVARAEAAEDQLLDIAKGKVLRDAFRSAMEDELEKVDAAVLKNTCRNIEFVARMNAAIENVSQIAALQNEAERADKISINNSLNRARRDISIEDRELAIATALFRARIAAGISAFLGVSGDAAAAVAIAAEKVENITPATLKVIYAGAEKDFYDCFLVYWEKGKAEGDDNRTIFQNFKISRELQREAAMRRAAALAAEEALLGDDLTEEEIEELYEEEEALDEEEEEEELEDDGYPYFWSLDEWNKAMNAFQEEAKKYTRLPILNSEEIFFFAIGVPRDFAGTDQAKKMVETLQTGLQTYYEKNYIGLEDDAMFFGMPGPDELKLTHAQLGYVGDVIEIISDLGVRIAGPQRPQPGTPEADSDRELEHIITALSEFSRIDVEEEDDEYDIYRFRVKVYSNMSGVMGIINRLNSAVDERRFYMIRRMDITSYIDEAHEIRYEANLDDEDTASIVPEDGVTIGSGVTGISRSNPGMPGSMPGMPKRNTRSASSSRTPAAPVMPGAAGSRSGRGSIAGIGGMGGLSGMDSSAVTSRRRVRESELEADQENGFFPGANPARPSAPGMMPGMMPGFGAETQQINGYYDEYGQFVYVEEEREEDKPLAERAEYAKPVIGEFTEMDVEFIIDYYIVKNSDFDNE